MTDMYDISNSSPRLGPAERAKRLDAQLWYSRRDAVFYVAVLFVLILGVSSLIPPFQASDEFYHVQRAYRLAKGQLILDRENGVTGAQFDTGLLEYMRNFENMRWFVYDVAERWAQSSPYVCLGDAIKWSGRTRFERVPNTASYFPLPYAPQAIALVLGEHASLTVGQTYYLTRLLSLSAALVVLWCAMIVYPMPLFVLALFVTPMSFFQLGSATLDAITFPLCVLTASLFTRGCNLKYSFSVGMHVALFICVLALATSRPYLIVLALLPGVLYFVRRSRSYLVSCVALVALSLAWILFVTATVNSGNGHDPEIRAAIVNYYVTHVGAFFKVLAATISDFDLLKFYWRSFVGMLGWTSGYLDFKVYAAWGVLLPVLAFSSLHREKGHLASKASLSLLGCAVAALMLTFFMELATWTPHPAAHVEGVAGRHFTPLLILMGFALFRAQLSPNMLKVGLVTLFLMAAVTTVGLTRQLLSTYWVVKPGTASATLAEQRNDCGSAFVDIFFDLRSQSRCDRVKLEITAKLYDSSGEHELCPGK